MTAITFPNLFGGRRAGANKPRTNSGPAVVKRYFLGKDFNSAWDYLVSTDIAVTTLWGCIQNVQAVEGIEGGVVYVCPDAEQHPQFEAILEAIRDKPVRLIFLIEVKTAELQ